MTDMTNQQLRQQLKQARMQLDSQQRWRFSATIAEKVACHPAIVKAKNIACYVAFAGEVSTTAIIDGVWQAGKSCFLPCTTDHHQLQFFAYQADSQLQKNTFGFQEPRPLSQSIAVTQLQAVIVPLVGFNQQCYRLGMGAGHYDRSFAFRQSNQQPPYLLGIAFDCQKTNDMIVNDWDVPLDAIITQTTIYER